MSRDNEGSSSNRAACIALEDAIAYAGSRRLLILLTDSKCLLRRSRNGLEKESTRPSRNPQMGTTYEKF